MRKKFTLFETFVGVGGSHIGFARNGYKSLYVNDICHEAIESLLINNPEIRNTAFIDERSIMDVNPNDLLKITKIKQNDLDVLFGGIVCKGFSLAGERSPNDERNYFYRKQLEFVSCLKPKVSIIENVPGIMSGKVLSKDTPKHIVEEVNLIWKQLENYKGKKANLRKLNLVDSVVENEGKELREKKAKMFKMLEKNKYFLSVYEDILESYNQLGYKVYSALVNSACYGSATKRERIIIVAVRNDISIEYKFPLATHGNDQLMKKYPYLYNEQTVLPVKTVNDALSEIDYTNKEDYDNIPMQHSKKTVSRFALIPEGENIAMHMDSIPDELKISKFYSRGNTMRLDGNSPSPTLVPGHSNFPIHPKENRSITVREAATITGFPTTYKFIGSHTKRCEEVGNAVPPPLSAAIAKSIKYLLKEYYKK